MQARNLIALAGCLALSAASALDLTPQTATRQLEGGFQVEILQFTHEGKLVHYRPPAGWEVTGGGTALTLTPSEIPQALGKIVVVLRDAKSGSVTAPDEELEKWITGRFLPKDVTNIERVEINGSPFMLGAIPSREYVYRYRRSTATFMKSISVVDLNAKERVVVEVTAGQTHFEAANRAMNRSLFSWEWED